MARTQLAVTTTAAGGTTLPAAVAVDQANGNSFTNTGREMIEITNGAASNINVTFTTNGVYSVGSVQYAIADLVVLVVNATTKVCGPFDKALFNDGAGNVDVDWSSGTSITARVISLGSA
ncbi:MAG TPA: hypothetical protein VFB50_15865 [Chloroflexota bacterium]|nr:hypothetical protein [Chloroflexota bacterium]